ncbi:MAG: NAD-dependent epimerase/dehydratase family protein [bacterium]
MSRYKDLCEEIRSEPRRWLVTGAAGFIGSHLVENLLGAGQEVVALDSLITGHAHNLDKVRALVGAEAAARLTFLEGDIRDEDTCRRASEGIRHVLHQAALGSVPRSIKDPIASHAANVDGFLKMANAARENGVESMSYASSSSVYGDHPALPKVEGEIGNPLSPYASTKLIDEIYAAVLHRCYGMRIAGLRYFNVVGTRQDPNGAYAAVIPRWIRIFLDGGTPEIYGDGETSRDFCPVQNVVQANLLAATTEAAAGEVFNIALGGRTTLTDLYFHLRDALVGQGVDCGSREPIYKEFRDGDVRHSLANTDKAQSILGYTPEVSLAEGLSMTVAGFVDTEN